MSPLWHCHAPCQRSSAYSRNGESDNGNYEVEPARIRVAFFSSTFLPPLRMLSGGKSSGCTCCGMSFFSPPSITAHAYSTCLWGPLLKTHSSRLPNSIHNCFLSGLSRSPQGMIVPVQYLIVSMACRHSQYNNAFMFWCLLRRLAIVKSNARPPDSGNQLKAGRNLIRCSIMRQY